MSQSIDLPIEGGCQCGALRYRILSAPLMIYACHCANCQRIAGSAFGLATTITEASLEFSAGKPNIVRWTSDAGNARYGTYCGACGCRIAHGQNPTNGILSLRAGTIDDTRWVAPAAHIWTRSAQPWFEFKSDDLLFDAQPTDYAPIVQKFNGMFSFA